MESFQNKNYELQKNIIMNGNSLKPIYIGAQTLDSEKKNATLMGNTLFNERLEAKRKAGVLDEFLKDPDFIDSVLNPETLCGEKWTPQLNRAFMEGAILSSRDVILITNPEHYSFDNKAIVNNGTFYELNCLLKNGYKFKKKLKK